MTVAGVIGQKTIAEPILKVHHLSSSQEVDRQRAILCIRFTGALSAVRNWLKKDCPRATRC
jgi:hypothetical protein